MAQRLLRLPAEQIFPGSSPGPRFENINFYKLLFSPPSMNTSREELDLAKGFLMSLRVRNVGSIPFMDGRQSLNILSGTSSRLKESHPEEMREEPGTLFISTPLTGDFDRYYRVVLEANNLLGDWNRGVVDDAGRMFFDKLKDLGLEFLAGISGFSKEVARVYCEVGGEKIIYHSI